MADKLRASQVKQIKRASNGRAYALLKEGGSRMLSDEDAKRLRSQMRGSSSSSAPKKKKGKKKASKKKKTPTSASSSTSSSSSSSSTKRRPKRFITDYFR